jgi:hypothetical protein
MVEEIKTTGSAAAQSDEEKLLNDPFWVMLGGKKFPIKRRKIRMAREWRQKVLTEFFPRVQHNISKIALLTADLKSIAANPKPAMEAARFLLVEFPDELLTLALEYSPDLLKERAWIEDNASEEQALILIKEVFSVAFPLGEMLKVIGVDVKKAIKTANPS